MLNVSGLAKRYPQHGRVRTLFEDLSFDLGPTERLGCWAATAKASRP